MKKIILSILILINGLMANDINEWFNTEYEYLKPYMVDIDDGSRERYGDIIYITVINNNGKKVKTFFSISMRESRLAQDCSLDIESEIINGKRRYTLFFHDFCSMRLSNNALKDLINSQMNQILPIISNVYNKTFNEPIDKIFLKE